MIANALKEKVSKNPCSGGYEFKRFLPYTFCCTSFAVVVVGTVVFGRCSHQAELVNLCGLSRPSSFLFYVQRTRSQSERERETRYLLALDYYLWTQLDELKYRLIYNVD